MSTYTGKFKPEKQQLNILAVSVAKRKVCPHCKGSGIIAQYDVFGIFIVKSWVCSCRQT